MSQTRHLAADSGYAPSRGGPSPISKEQRAGLVGRNDAMAAFQSIQLPAELPEIPAFVQGDIEPPVGRHRLAEEADLLYRPRGNGPQATGAASSGGHRSWATITLAAFTANSRASISLMPCAPPMIATDHSGPELPWMIAVRDCGPEPLR
jgi:hypothetical protein